MEFYFRSHFSACRSDSSLLGRYQIKSPVSREQCAVSRENEGTPYFLLAVSICLLLEKPSQEWLVRQREIFRRKKFPIVNAWLSYDVFSNVIIMAQNDFPIRVNWFFSSEVARTQWRQVSYKYFQFWLLMSWNSICKRIGLQGSN